MRKRILGRLLPLLIVAILALAVYLMLDFVAPAPEMGLKASGSVEAEQVIVAPECPGRVEAIWVEEGQFVEAGQALFRLEDAALSVQRERVLAAGVAAEAAAELQILQAKQDLDVLYEDWRLMAAQAELALAQARDALDDAERRATYQQKGHRATSETIEATEAQLVLAEDAVKKAREAFNRVKDKPEKDPQRAAALAALHEAEEQRDAIVRLLNWYTGEPTDIDQALLDAQVAVAMAQVADAEKEWAKWREGPDPEKVALAKARLDQANAQLLLAQAQTRAELLGLDRQIGQLTIRAPMDGVILSRHIQVGEVVTAGTSAFTLGDLNRLIITVYVPEDRYGQILLGSPVTIEADSFPGQEFEGTVRRIADEAEFTPRNVQTEEGRRTMVFAVEIAVEDPQGRLKPGMPADVIFQR